MATIFFQCIWNKPNFGKTKFLIMGHYPLKEGIVYISIETIGMNHSHAIKK